LHFRIIAGLHPINDVSVDKIMSSWFELLSYRR
jgi:hypothetical protein